MELNLFIVGLLMDQILGIWLLAILTIPELREVYTSVPVSMHCAGTSFRSRLGH